ncbi:hypothetical protein SBADM41S_02588 [Streptomyces badius]
MTDPVGKLPSELDQLPDRDPEETAEWAASLDAVTKAAGPHRAAYLMRRSLQHAEGAGFALPKLLETDYVNTIPTAAEPAFDGDLEMESKITAWNRWNAAAMVTRGSRFGVGGHIATFASAAWLYETGFNHFFRGKEGDGSGDQLYIQGHASPGIYARAFLDGRLTEQHLDNFRQESGGEGLPSYPHPRRLPWLWEFPTVSMGLGPLSAIYQARFNRYLANRSIKDTANSHVWAFLGDGEMDEPESTAALALAAREQLDNLTFVINCNLQRLDGPVRANFRVVQELEAQFRGAGWNVVKTLWGNAWDELFQLDTQGALLRRLREVPDAQFQTYATRDVAYIREHFFGTEPALVELAKLLTDAKIAECFYTSRGGHEARKVYAAYRAAVEHKGAPTVILAQTVKGYTLGKGFESKNANHQMKKLSIDEFKGMRELLGLPIPDSAFQDGLVPYGHPGADSPEVRYLQERRAALGGPAPARRAARLGAAAAARGARVQGPVQGVRQAGDGHHHGVRPPGEGPDAGQGDRQALGADRPGRGPYLRYGGAPARDARGRRRRASSRACTASRRARPRRRTRRASSCWPPVRRSTGPWRPRSCWPPTGVSRPTSGPPPRGASCAATRWRPTRRCSAVSSRCRT